MVVENKAPGLWRNKYKDEVDVEKLDWGWAEGISACHFEYDGPTKLTPAEQRATQAVAETGVGFSQDMLWVFVEKLGWWPGMLRQGIIPSPMSVQELYKWPSGREDPEIWVIIGLYYLAQEVEGMEYHTLEYPLYYPLGDTCDLCGQEKGIVIEHVDYIATLEVGCGKNHKCTCW